MSKKENKKINVEVRKVDFLNSFSVFVLWCVLILCHSIANIDLFTVMIQTAFCGMTSKER